MNKIVIAVGLSAVVTISTVEAFADSSADYVEGEKSAALVTPEVEAAAGYMLGQQMASNLLHAVKLQMAKYDRDMTSKSGRQAWHGKLVRSEVYTNDLCQVEVYSNEVDGAVWRYRAPFKPVDRLAEVKAANANLANPVMTNGIPARLAAARLRREAEKQTVSNVTERISVGL